MINIGEGATSENDGCWGKTEVYPDSGGHFTQKSAGIVS